MSDVRNAAHWLDHAEKAAHLAQQALDDLDSLNAPAQWGEVKVAQRRNELIAARAEYVDDAEYWRNQLNRQGVG